MRRRSMHRLDINGIRGVSLVNASAPTILLTTDRQRFEPL